MSVAFILNPTYSYVENERLNPALEVSESVTAPIHYVEDLSISKTPAGNMSISAPVVEATQLQAPVAVLDTVSTGVLIPIDSGTETIQVSGNLDMTNYDISNVNEITSNGVLGTTIGVKNVDGGGYYQITGDTLGVEIDANIRTPSNITCNTLNYTALNPPISSSTPTLASVLAAGNSAGSTSINMNSQNITAVSTISASTVSGATVGGNTVKANTLTTNDPTQTQINLSKNLNLGPNILYAQTASIGDITVGLTTRFGVEPNRFTGFDAYSLAQENGDNRVVSDSAADLIGFHDVQSLRGKFFTTDASGVEKFSATDTGAVSCVDITTSKVNIPSLTPAVGQVLAASNVDGSIYWKTDAAGDLSQWSTYPAIQIVDMNNNTLDNAFSVYSKTFYSVDNLEGGNIYSNNLTIQDGGGVPKLTITPVGDVTTSGTIQSADITVGTTSGQQVILSNIGGVRCSSLNIPSDALTPAFSITNDGIAFTTKLEIGETLADASNSVGTAGQLLSSTGTATAWVDAPVSATPSLGDVMTVGNTASADLNMNNNDITNTSSLTLNGTYNIIQSVGAISNALEFTTEFGFASLKCDSIDTDGLFSNTITIANTATVGSIINNGFFKDATSSSGTVGQLLSSTGTATAWVDAPVSVTPSLGDVMTVGNTASADLDMNSNNITGAVDVGCVSVTATGQVKGRTFKSDEESKDAAFENKLGTFTVFSNGQVFGTTGTFSEGLEITQGVVQLGTGNVYMSNNKVSVSDATGTITTTGDVVASQLIPSYKPLRTLWVSSNNAYATPNGSYENPYTTIQAAITYAESVYDNTYWYINVLPGTYAGFTATKKVFVKGMAPSNPDGCSVGCQITSDITVAIDANDGDMFNNQFSLSGFLVTAKIVDSSTARHVLNIVDSYLYNDSGTGRLIDCRPASTDCRLIILNSRLTNVSSVAGDPLVEMSVGMARFGQSFFQCAGVQNVVKFSGSSRVDSIVLCSFTSTNASAVIPAIIEVTSSATSAFTFANCSFVYSSATDKSANPSSCALFGNAAATSTIFTIISNTFALAGTSNATNFVVNHGAVPCVTLFFSNSATLNTTHTINGNNNTTKFSLQAVA